MLHRTTRRLSLSSEGEVYFARARQILADVEDAEAEVARSRGAPRGLLRVNTSNAFGIHQLAPALPDFMTRYPEIRLELAITDRIIDLASDPADVTIRAGHVGETRRRFSKAAYGAETGTIVVGHGTNIGPSANLCSRLVGFLGSKSGDLPVLASAANGERTYPDACLLEHHDASTFQRALNRGQICQQKCHLPMGFRLSASPR